MKKIAIALLLLLCLSLAVPAFGAEPLPRLVDEADYLTDAEEAYLLSRLDAISDQYDLDVVIVTVPRLRGRDITAYADDFYDDNGYRPDGILLLIADYEREWAISTTGYGITAFTDAGQAYITDQFVDTMSDGDFNTAFHTFADLCDQFIAQARTGAPYDRGNLPKGEFDAVGSLLMALAVGLLAALIVTALLKSQLKTVRSQTAASQYTQPGSLNITQSQDLYLYRHVTRRKRESSSGSRGGGSSTHRSSSGRSHGGSRGRF